MFPVQPLPDGVLHAQFRLLATALPAGARRTCIVRLSALKFVERPDIAARFAVLFEPAMQPVAGVQLRPLGSRHRSAVSDNGNWPRGDVVHEARFEVHNTSSAPVTFNTVVTLSGFAAEQLEEDAAYPAAPALSAQALELEAQNMACVPLTARFEAIAERSLLDDMLIINGEKTVDWFNIGEKREVYVNHAADANFRFCEYPRLGSIPVGLRAKLLACAADVNNSNVPTDGNSFALEVENVSYESPGGVNPTFPITWTRRGFV
jgi:hypothetical protein